MWATLFPLANDSRPLVVAVAALDSQSMFDKSSVGAESGMSAVIVLTAAAQALGALWDSNATASALSNLTHNLLFFFPHAESFDRAGSRRLVDDLLHFQCDDRRPSDDGDFCFSPWSASLDFLALRGNASDGATGLDRIARILELGQVGLNASFYAHVERDVNPVRQAWVEQLLTLARNVSGLTLGRAADDTPGIPPAAAESFLAGNARIPVVVLADHRREYINRYHHSQYDVGRTNLLHADGATDTSPSMCALATLVARALFVAAGGNASYVPAIQADCRLVVQLLVCLTIDSTCPQMAAFRPGQCPPSAPSHLPGAWFPNFPPESYTWGEGGTCRGQPSSVYPLYVASLLDAAFANTSAHARYHDALDPLLRYTPFEGYEVRQGNGSRLWTVSNAIARTGRVYRVESDAVVYTTLALGVALLVGTTAAMVGSRRWVAQHFKTL